MARFAAAVVAALVLAPAAGATTAHFDVTYRLTTTSGTSEVVAHGVADGASRRAKAEVETPGRLLHLLFDGRAGIAVYVSGTGIAAQAHGKPWLLSHNVEVLPLGDPTVALRRTVRHGATTVALTTAETARIAPGAGRRLSAAVTTDARGRIVRFVVHAQSGGALVTMDERLSQFGTPADVTLPGRRDVFDTTIDTVHGELMRFALAARDYADAHRQTLAGVTRTALKRYDKKLAPNIAIAHVSKRGLCVETHVHGVWVRLKMDLSGATDAAIGRC